MRNLLLLLNLMVCCLGQITNTNEKNAKIVRQINNISPDGSQYNYAYETENNIFVEEQGFLKDGQTQVAQGQYQFTSPEGKVFHMVYVADENGFQPQSDYLPTAPPIPPAILRALDYIATKNRNKL